MRELDEAGEAAAEPPPNVPDYWLGHPEQLTKGAGRTALCGICATPRRRCCGTSIRYRRSTADTPALPLGAIVTPGNYRGAAHGKW